MTALCTNDAIQTRDDQSCLQSLETNSLGTGSVALMSYVADANGAQTRRAHPSAVNQKTGLAVCYFHCLAKILLACVSYTHTNATALQALRQKTSAQRLGQHGAAQPEDVPLRRKSSAARRSIQT